MLDKQNRLTIPAELLKRSNLDGISKIYITLVKGDLLFIPAGEKIPPDVKIYGIRHLDKEKGRIILPKGLADISRDWLPYLLDGEIWATRHID